MREPSSGGPEGPDGEWWRAWADGRAGDLDAFLAGLGPADPADLVAVLLVDQQHRWEAGQRVPAEAYLRRFPALCGDPEAAVEVAYGEFLLRERRGERPALAEYQWRFPEHAGRLA